VQTANTKRNGLGVSKENAYTLDSSQGQDVAYTTKMHNTTSNQSGKFYEEYSPSLQENSPPPVVISKGNHHANATQTNAGKILQALRDQIGEEVFTQWSIGVLASFFPSPVLQQVLHGGQFRYAPFAGRWLVYCTSPCEKDRTQGAMLTVRQTQGEGCPPQGREPSEQLAIELGAYLSQLSQPGAQAQRFMHDLWCASEGIGILRKALSAVQEARQPVVGDDGSGPEGFYQDSQYGAERYDPAGTLREGRSPHHQMINQTYGVRRLLPVECEFLQGFPRNWTRYATKPDGTVYEQSDTQRYRQLGNAVTMSVAEWIGRILQKPERGKR
jgi:hypothetical protein